jgi:hypothetical protein
LDRQQRFIFGNGHGSKQTSAAFGVGLATLSAAKTAKAVTLFPELHAFKVAGRAIHTGIVQQPLVVCQLEVSLYNSFIFNILHTLCVLV